MTDLPTILPDFPTRSFTHLIPALDRHGITVADLLTLDALEIAKRASLPILDLRRLAQDVADALQDDLEISTSSSKQGLEKCKRSAGDVLKGWDTVSILDEALDEAIGGGIPAGYVTEITGESAAGKTQFLLTLLLSAQLPAPLGLSRSSIYISTEAPLSTTRLAQLLESHPRLLQLPAAKRPSLSRVLAIPVQDLECQDHILAFQLPNAVRKYNVGLVIIDSVAANYRAEHGSMVPRDLANRAAQLAKLGEFLRDLAKQENIVIVVANQVSDRFKDPNGTGSHDHRRPASPMISSSPGPPSTQGAPSSATEHPDPSSRESTLSLDFQQRFFTGWGDEASGSCSEGLKTPALGLGWTTQIACRIALKIEACMTSASTNGRTHTSYGGGNIWKDKKKRRFLRLVFAPWTPATMDQVEYEIRPEGIAACKTGEGSHTRA